MYDPESNHGGPDPLAGTEGTNDHPRMYAPVIGPIDALTAVNLGISSRKPGSKFTFAYANYAPYGGGMAHREEDNPNRVGSKSLYVQHLVYAAPTVSYQISKTISIGASIGFGQRAMGIEMDLRAPNDLAALTRVVGDATKGLEIPVWSEQNFPPPFLGGGLGPYERAISFQFDARDDYVPNINWGVLWKPKRWFSFGFCYQSETKAELSGNYKFTYSEQFQRQTAWNGSTQVTSEGAGMLDLPMVAVESQEGALTATHILPQRVQTGIMLQPFSWVKLMGDLHWANWSVVKEDRFTFDQRIQLLRLAKMMGYQYQANEFVVERSMKDTWHWSVGMEIKLFDGIYLRGGYEKRPSSLQMPLYDALYFIPDVEYYGTGLGIELDSGITLDFALGYLFNEGLKLNNNS
ncbi:MAG: hypothetical protein GY751_13980, partial [Bacteroidetes bacterium]|nr:hypothetical protein [Bacteroidota bacterium]